MSERARLDGPWIVVEGLRFLAADREAALRFFALTGLAAHDLRAVAAEPGFAATLLEVLVEDADILRRFARAAGCEPADLMAVCEARRQRDAWQDP